MSNPSEPQSLLTDEQLNDAERAFIAMFENKDETPDSSSGVSSAETEPQIEAPPSEASVPAAPGETATPVEGQEVSPESEGQIITPPVASEGESTPEGTAQPQPAFTFAGNNYDETTLARAVQLHDWFNGLNNQQVAAIDALLSGQYTLTPVSSATPTAPVTQQQQEPPVASSGQSPSSSTSPEPEGDWLDPRAQAEVNRLQSELAQLRSTIQSSLTPVVQDHQQQHMNRALADIDAATTEFQTRYSLSPDQVEAIQTAVRDAQVLPGLHARHGGDLKAAMNAALDMMFWTTPSFRDSYIASRTQSDLADLTRQEQEDTIRKQQMTALSATGGSVPRREPVPSTKEDRFTAMRDEIASAVNGQ